MPFKVATAKWLQVEADRVEAIILMPRFWHRAWTPQSLKTTLEEMGLGYSLPEVEEINEELHNRGVVEDQGPE